MLQLTNCTAPSILQTSNNSHERATKHFKTIPGITNVESIHFDSIQGQLSNQELMPYPTLKTLYITKSDIENLDKEFFQCK